MENIMEEILKGFAKNYDSALIEDIKKALKICGYSENDIINDSSNFEIYRIEKDEGRKEYTLYDKTKDITFLLLSQIHISQSEITFYVYKPAKVIDNLN